MHGAAAGARLAVYGGSHAGKLNLGHRLEAARCAAALLAVPFVSTMSHPQRAVDFAAGVASIPPSQLWDHVDLSGSDLYRFDAGTMCFLATATGEAVAAAGRPLEALPALAFAEHLAAHALRDVAALANVRSLQAAALADAGCLAASADRIAGLIAGAGLPSIATGACGRIASAPVVPGFRQTQPVGAPENKPTVDCVAGAEVQTTVAAMYGPAVGAQLASARARWLLAAAPAVEWKSGAADPITAMAIPADGGVGSGGAVDVEARGALLASAEGILRGLIATTTACVAAQAAAEQDRIIIDREKRSAEKSERAAAAAAQAEERAAAVAAATAAAVEAAAARDKDADATAGTFTTPEATGVRVEATEEEGKGEEAKVDDDQEEEEKDEEDVVGEAKSPWILATSSQIRILSGAKVQLAGVLRAQHRPKAAFDEAVSAARELEALGGGGGGGGGGSGARPVSGFAPGGARSTAAAAALSCVGHLPWLSSRVECAWALLELGQVFAHYPGLETPST